MGENMGSQIPPKNFSISSSIEEILYQMDRSNGNTEIIHAGPCFLNYKLHKELMKDQQSFQKEQLGKTNQLVTATWILAGATIVLAVATIILVFVTKK